MNHFENDLISVVNLRSYNAEIKTDENAFEASDQDPTDGVSGVTSKAHDVTKSQRSICDPTAMT